MKRITVYLICLLFVGALWAAGEMSCDDTTGLTKYAVIYNADGNAALTDGSAFEEFATADLYDIAMTEKGVGGHYVADAPAALIAGRYSYTLFTQAVANPANGDDKTHTGKFVWSGTVEVYGPNSVEVQVAAAAALTVYDPPTKAEIDTGFATAKTERDANDTEIKAKTDLIPAEDVNDQNMIYLLQRYCRGRLW